MGLAEALRLAVAVLATPGSGAVAAGPTAPAIPPERLEVAVLDRAAARRAFRRLDAGVITGLLGP
jgi:hypothetical protein